VRAKVLGDRGGGGRSHSMCVIGPVRECFVANGWEWWWAITITWVLSGGDGMVVRIARAREHGWSGSSSSHGIIIIHTYHDLYLEAIISSRSTSIQLSHQRHSRNHWALRR
jgi:hypothetical protein